MFLYKAAAEAPRAESGDKLTGWNGSNLALSLFRCRLFPPWLDATCAIPFSLLIYRALWLVRSRQYHSLCDWCAELSSKNPRMALGTRFLACHRWRLVYGDRKSQCATLAKRWCTKVGSTHHILTVNVIIVLIPTLFPRRASQAKFVVSTRTPLKFLPCDWTHQRRGGYVFLGCPSHINSLNPILRPAPFMESNAGQTEIGCHFLLLTWMRFD